MPLCPVCHVAMVQVEEADVVAESCPNCHGTWISGHALERRARLETTPGMPHMTLAPLADLADTVSHSNSTGVLSCPDCRRDMIKGRFHPQIPVQIDRCDACGHIWLDAGEQGLLVRLYQELVSSQGTPIPGQQERLERLQQIQNQPPVATSGFTKSEGLDIAVNIGTTVLSVLIDMLLMPGGRSRRW
jgi:Zn-finger nucleic acid-binding protein